MHLCVHGVYVCGEVSSASAQFALGRHVTAGTHLTAPSPGNHCPERPSLATPVHTRAEPTCCVCCGPAGWRWV